MQRKSLFLTAIVAVIFGLSSYNGIRDNNSIWLYTDTFLISFSQKQKPEAKVYGFFNSKTKKVRHVPEVKGEMVCTGGKCRMKIRFK
jgi:hypothetical protein